MILKERRRSIDLLPDITFPTLTIRTEYPGSAPAEVENLITIPIEEAVGVVSGVVSISSISRPGLSDVVVEFDWGTRMDFASLEIREKLDRVRITGRFHSVEAIGSIVISEQDTPFIKLEDVAVIGTGIKERTVITRTNGRESVEIAIFKEAATNTVAVAGRIRTS